MTDNFTTMLAAPVPSKDSGVFSGVTAIQYKATFKWEDLQPEIGNIFRFFIDQNYFRPSHKPIQERQLYGSTYNAPTSDLVCMAMHFGCLHFQSKRKATTRRRLLTTKNALEICLCGEAEYHKRATTMPVAQEIDLKGVVVTVCVERSPNHFPQVNRNGIRSRDTQVSFKYSLRISNYYLLTEFDEMPQLVEPQDYVRQNFMPIQLVAQENGESMIPFSRAIWAQIITRLNIANGMFTIFRIFLVLGDGKAELMFVEGTKMRVVAASENLPANELAKKKLPLGATIAEGHFHQFVPKENGLQVGDVEIAPVLGIIMIQLIGAGKSFRSKDKLG